MQKSLFLGITVLYFSTVPFALPGETKTEAIEKTFPIDEASPVFLEFKERDGSLRFRAWQKNRVHVRVVKTARERSNERAAELLAKTRVETSQTGNRIRVRVTYPKPRIAIFGTGDYHKMRVETEIMVPYKTNLTCRTDDGNITGEMIEGRLHLRTDDGRIRVSHIKGALSVETEDGSIEGSEIKGSVEAISDDGDIHISGRLDWLDIRTEDGDVRAEIFPGSVMARDWKMRSDDGNVELYAPGDFAAYFRFRTDDGEIDNHLPVSFSAISSDTDISGRLNQGERTVYIDTEDGDISLRPFKKR